MKRKRFILRTLLLAISGLSLVTFHPHRIFASGTVTVCDEANLRAAVAGGGLVTFNCGGTIVLTNQIVITNDTVLDATGYDTTISGGNLVRLFTVNSGVMLDLRKLTLANGSVTGQTTSNALGGAILSLGGTLVLNDCLFWQNTLTGGPSASSVGQRNFAGNALGGAIWSSNGIVRATNTWFKANQATGGKGVITGISQEVVSGDGYGGALYQIGGETVMVKCRLETNAVGSLQATSAGFQTIADAGRVSGAAIWHSNGVITLIECEFISNRAVSGMAIRHGASGGARGGALFSSSQLSISNCCFLFNSAIPGEFSFGLSGPSSEGGALFLVAPAVITRSTFKWNSAHAGMGYTGGLGAQPGGIARGGSIYNGSTLTLIDSTVAFNEARGANGGPSLSSATPGTAGFGGGLFNVGTVLATNLTFTDNRTIGGTFSGNPGPSSNTAGGNSHGGGLCNLTGSVHLVSSTLAGNSAIGGGGNPVGGGFGGGIFNTNGTVTVSGTIIANSLSGGNASGVLTDIGYNLSSDASCAFTGTGSLNNTDPVLGPLDNYDGLTPTMALLSGSPAIDGGNPALFPATDQRGRARPFGPAPDMGAFESSSPYTIRGLVFGFGLQGEVSVTAGVNTVSTTNHGTYRLDGLSANTYSVFPQSADYLFVPTHRVVTVGPDQVGINFKAYRWNALTLDDVTNQVMHVIFATTNAPTYRLLASPDLIQWSPTSTNAIGPGNYSEILIPIGTEPARFYRAVSP